MRQLPVTAHPIVLRTDFSNERTWEAICAAIQTPVDGFQVNVSLLSDPAYAGLTIERIAALISPGSNHTFLFIVDGVALSHPDHPILVLDLFDQPDRTFRVIPSEMWGVENNLSLANMDFDEFAGAVDNDGIFRGF